MMTAYYLLALALLATSALGQDNIDPYNDKNLNGVPVQTVDGLDPPENATLDCDDTVEYAGNNTYPHDSVPTQWLLPREADGNIPIVLAGQSTGNIEVSPDARYLYVRGVTRDNIGTYHCMRMQTDGEWYLVRLGLNTRGPYFINDWEEWYKAATFRGFFGFFTTFAIISTTAILYGFIEEWRQKKIGANDVQPEDPELITDRKLSMEKIEKNGEAVVPSVTEKVGMENPAYQSMEPEANTVL